MRALATLDQWSPARLRRMSQMPPSPRGRIFTAPATEVYALHTDHPPPAAPAVDIVPFQTAHAAAYYALNRAWLDEHALYEPADELQLATPQAYIIEKGGAVFIAVENGVVIGTAAVIPHGPGEMEIAKLTVAANSRGLGLGRRLAEACVRFAADCGTRRVVLVSSHLLDAAVALYESMGFVHRPMPSIVAYETADVYMELDLPLAS